ncbi:MAG TPA: alkaline phosphatase family protein [Streptosporangiaceae bacterium]|nr:alkaline phosphatase family protein [Streptosporangiaceae bacterium]
MADQQDIPVSGGADIDPNTSRRGLLKAGLIAGAAVGVGGWRPPGDLGTGQELDQHARSHLRKPGSLPYPNLAPGTDTIPKIDHIVVLMMENHSYDNKLGMLNRPGADGFRIGAHGKPTATNPYANGDLQHAFRMPTTCQMSGKPSQTWKDSHFSFATGRNDGFVKSASGPVAMGYWQWADQPFYYSLARVFPIADRYFCSLLGQTFPNRRFLISATSLGMVNDSVPDPAAYPKNGTIFDRLDDVGVSWKNYYSTVPTTALYPKLYLANAGHKVVKIRHFFSDAANGKLPGFSLVDPDFVADSEEDPQNIAAGEHFAARVIDAVMRGPGWPRTLLIWTYDEHGGYYDHVPPPRAIAPDDIAPDVPKGQSKYDGFTRYGFRVPCAVVSPFARPNYVSHQVFDHTSVCALVEAKWNLPAMTYRDANANAMLDMLELSKPAFAKPPELARPLLTAHPVSTLKCDVTGPGEIPPPGSITKPPA